MPYKTTIKYDQYVRYLFLWYGEVLGISAQEFKSQYGPQTGRSGGVSATFNAGTPLNYGVNMVIGHLSTAKTLHEERCQISSFRFFGGYRNSVYY